MTALASAFVGTVSFLAYRRITQPVSLAFGTPPPPDHLPREPVSFISLDGTPLAAWYIPGVRPEPILLLHGYGATKREMLHHAAFLHAGGYPVLLLDLRCCGESGGRAVTFGGREREDVAAALAYLRGRPDVDAERLGVLGLSLGGALALLAAADCPAVRAVVAESSFANIKGAVRQNFRAATRLPHFPFAALTVWLVERRWGVRADRVAPDREIGARDDCAVLLIHAENDNVVGVQDAHAIFSAARGPKELWLIPAAGHAMAYLTEREAYAERVRGFFDRWLPAGVVAADGNTEDAAGDPLAAAG
jgi:alpha-beta hydrolase superfamily lysophospholipase